MRPAVPTGSRLTRQMTYRGQPADWK